MRSKILLTVGFLIWASSAVRADMIEVKGKGALNGKVISQSEAQIVFKDNENNLQTFSKQDVLYMDAASAEFGEVPVAQKIRLSALEFLKWVKRLPEEYKKLTERYTNKFLKNMSKPLDRSGANAKASALAAVTDKASRAAEALSKKNLRIDQELKKNKQETFALGGAKDRRKGRFTSLEN